jgi:hypothetical protein
MRQLVTSAIVMMAAAALTLPAHAQQITLSCNGTSKLMATAAADLTPEPIKNLGIIVNVADRTVTFMDYVTPVTGITATLVSFHGQQNPTAPAPFGLKGKRFTIDGSIDRVTGHAEISWWHEDAGNNSSWELSCRPATRLLSSPPACSTPSTA